MRADCNKKKNGRRRGDDRGMTLLELIIAVAIFSIAAMSLLQAFVTSGRINNKSNLYLEATTTAQNVMEEIKAKSFTDLAAAFNYPTETSFSFLKTQMLRNDGSLSIKEMLMSSDGTYKNVSLYNSSTGDESSVTASVISTDGGLTYELNPRTTGDNASKYYFVMSGVECLHETFDVLVEFDGSSDSQYKKSSTTEEDEKNDYEMPNIAKLSNETNGFLIIPEDWGEDVLSMWKTNYSLDQGVSIGDVKKTVTISLEEKGGNITAKAQYQFSYGDSAEYKYTGNETAFFSTEVGSTLEGLYIFYYPNYNSTSAVASRRLDNIIFKNYLTDTSGAVTSGPEINFYVVKQMSESTDSAGETVTVPSSAQEKSYRMNLTIWERPTKSNWRTNINLYRAQTAVRTNLNYDISENAATDSSSLDQVKLVYQTVDSGRTESGSLSDANAEKVLDMNGLDDKEATDRIYTVKVSVYKTGAAAENFPDEDLVATLDGAKED